MIDLTLNKDTWQKAVQRARERDIIIPTFRQLIDPQTIPEAIKQELRGIGLWEVHPRNLFRTTWKNEPQASGGSFGDVNFLEIPRQLTGVDARIVALVGKWFPTGAHKVGAAFGCLVPRLVSGQFDPAEQKAVWPSTGNFCRGGAYISALLACDSIAILPEEMSRERFEWLQNIAGEVIATPGCESNVKEIYDKCWELRATRNDIVIFNQFEEFGNYLWHFHVTGHAVEEVFRQQMPEQRFAGFVAATGSAGTLAAGDYLKQQFPAGKIAAAEALQCPTLLLNGYGGHRIEGIGDKHVPWIHDVRNTDMVIAVDDAVCMDLLRLFNEPAGQKFLAAQAGIPESWLSNLPLLGISGIGNLVAAIKFARYYELTERDVVFTVFTDSMDLYSSRIRELRDEYGPYTHDNAVRDFYARLMGIHTDHMLELAFPDRKRIHNLKYFTWIEQQGRALEELNAQWYEFPEYWQAIQQQAAAIDARIEAFNREVERDG